MEVRLKLLGAPDGVSPKKRQILYGVTDSVTLALAVPSGREGLQPFSSPFGALLVQLFGIQKRLF